MKQMKRIVMSLFAGALALNATCIPAFAQEDNTPKEEVVYSNLNGDGSVKEVNVVNIFDLENDGTIVDYGTYESLRNMTTTDAIDYQNDTIHISSKKGKLYYEGKLKSKEIPWLISIQYLMDGKTYDVSEIAGKSGHLEIQIQMHQNENCDSSFFEGYALQTTITLDTNKTENIQADGATVANVGSNKQLTYTTLPNTDTDIHISADVVDFQMDAIAINGIRMNLDVEIDESEIQDKVDEIVGAVDALDEGAGSISEGATTLYDATSKLNTAAQDLYTGVGSLYSGSQELANGLSTITSNNKALTDGAWQAYEAMCSAAQSQLNAQLSAEGMEQVTLTPTTYADVLLGLLDKMNAETAYQTAYDSALSKVKEEVEGQADTLYAGYIQSQANTIYATYVQSQATTLYEQVASEAIIQQLVESGTMSQEQAHVYVTSEEGKILVENAIQEMDDETKQQIQTLAISNLTDEQKQQILQGAIDTLTEQQKTEIKNTYIQQMMSSDEVTSQINAAVEQVSEAASQVSQLKGQLDSYEAFYTSLVNYTNAVASSASGAATLTNGLVTLYNNTDIFKNAVGDLYVGVGTMKNGSEELKDGTQEFSKQTDGIDEKVSDEINCISDSITGKDVPTISFVSENNKNVNAVQFVIQTEAIKVDDTKTVTTKTTEELNFFQKFLQLFGVEE